MKNSKFYEILDVKQFFGPDTKYRLPTWSSLYYSCAKKELIPCSTRFHSDIPDVMKITFIPKEVAEKIEFGITTTYPNNYDIIFKMGYDQAYIGSMALELILENHIIEMLYKKGFQFDFEEMKRGLKSAEKEKELYTEFKKQLSISKPMELYLEL